MRCTASATIIVAEDMTEEWFHCVKTINPETLKSVFNYVRRYTPILPEQYIQG